MRTLVLTLLVAVALCGCAGVTPPPPTPTPTPTPPAATIAEQRTATAEALAVERQWLGSWFRDTPVRVAQRNDGAVSLEVPRAFCFDPGRSDVKPALAAVLDKVAESLRRVPLAQLTMVAAPDDAGGAAPLAVQRAVQVRDYLRSRGVPAARLGKPSAAGAASVQLRLADVSSF